MGVDISVNQDILFYIEINSAIIIHKGKKKIKHDIIEYQHIADNTSGSYNKSYIIPRKLYSNFKS